MAEPAIRWLRTRRDRPEPRQLAAVEDAAFVVRELLQDVRSGCGHPPDNVTRYYRDLLPLDRPARITVAQLAVVLDRLGYDLQLSAVPR